MRPFHEPDTSRQFIPADIKARVMPAVLDELARWGVERFSIEALAERHRLDAAMIYRYWGDRQRLIMDAALDDAEAIREALDTGSLRGDLLALARHIAAQINTMHGRIFLRALVMDGRGHHDTDTRLNYWRERFAVVRTVIDRARQRGELRDGINTLAAVQIVSSPLYIRGLYGDGPVDDGYCEIIADMAWHALARK
ncbi:TetR family transcriptional regulator [Mycobacterium kubicae]|uniref:TetR family transcriptional regulator n=1 Tax=Mycobacterium kubicae TaxID=120959 RepID=A0AAX1JBK2_9MYCO|nr:TetR-like C-terminal domain-containing protein [Mycobacterium kubicae]MCV7095213.1 TetR/AcrR family transcriptional regulator C-terminal ligand-binding domain-containing protein [Mycobacterium kubicae]ORV95116.1 TetR family transcriptional regulator [Mycobacterium kubicae]QNI14296.1 TetR family transcriptional regulator [Mycobacterium kubicae]QPI37814.1 TetR/AcrR family transcriptional regulator C-terminal ligand-binding domain-containing protein [Mycobacterium kubicae]GFG65874.1 TetR famil